MNGPTKPRSGPGRDTELIFDRPELQARRHRWVYSTLTLVAWVVWMYLWLPLITLVAWYFGVRTFLREMVIPDPGTVLVVGLVYLFVVANLGVLLISWSRYNLGRFGGKDRRKAPRGVPDSDVADYFGVEKNALAGLRAGRTLVFSHTPEGRVEEIEVAGLPKGGKAPAPPPPVTPEPSPASHR